ncbi:MAG: hypothetical protein ACTSU2_00785 [Promethearchaeota archaeon]
MVVDDAKLERNLKLIKKRLQSQIDESLEKGNKYIDKELSGFFYNLIKPVVKFFYNSLKKPEMAKGTLSQIDIILKAAREAAINPQIPLDDIIDKYFESYLEKDQTSLSLKKSHPNYKWCVKNTRDIFKAQLNPLVAMLRCNDENINTYNDLVMASFKTKQGTLEALTAQLTYMNAGLSKIHEDINILDLPVGKDVLFRVLKKGYQETWDELIEEVENMGFPQED